MIAIRTSVGLNAPIDVVWADLADLPSHVEWMRDAEAISVVGVGPPGVGETILADTRVGPIRVRDRMEITEWRPGAAIAVRHTGMVTGEGRFALEEIDGQQTRLTWDEHLRFPFLLGGLVGERIAAPILRALFRANLSAFAARHG